VLVDGKPIDLNPFVQNLFKRVVIAMVTTLKGVPEKARTLRIEVEE